MSDIPYRTRAESLQQDQLSPIFITFITPYVGYIGIANVRCTSALCAHPVRLKGIDHGY